MKVIIFEASGLTGRQLIEQALKQGHEVTAFVRKAGRIPHAHNNLRIVEGDVLNADEVEQAVIGQDAVLCAIGASGGSPSDICSEGTGHILLAMRKAGVPRIIAVTGFGISRDSRLQMRFGTKLVVWLSVLLFRRESMDKRQQDSRIRQSGLSWTIVEPPTLTDGPRTGRYRLDTARAPMLGRVSRADVADFMLDQLDSHEFNNKSTVIY